MRVEDAELILGALDTLGALLSGYNHQWSDGERTIYETSTTILEQEGLSSTTSRTEA